MEENTNTQGGYIMVAIGATLLLYAIYKLINGYSNGFEFHIWNLELRGEKALLINITYIIFCSLLVYSGIRKIKNESHK